MLKLIITILWVISVDCIAGFLLYLLWKYLDLKYFSSSEIEILRQENEYLKQENKKVNGTSSDFWSDSNG